MGKSLRVKKGNEVFEIQDTDLQVAVNDGYLPTDTVIVANSKTNEVYEIDPQDLPSAFKDGFSFKDVKKKETDSPLGGKVGSSVGRLDVGTWGSESVDEGKPIGKALGKVSGITTPEQAKISRVNKAFGKIESFAGSREDFEEIYKQAPQEFDNLAKQVAPNVNKGEIDKFYTTEAARKDAYVDRVLQSYNQQKTKAQLESARRYRPVIESQFSTATIPLSNYTGKQYQLPQSEAQVSEILSDLNNEKEKLKTELTTNWNLSEVQTKAKELSEIEAAIRQNLTYQVGRMALERLSQNNPNVTSKDIGKEIFRVLHPDEYDLYEKVGGDKPVSFTVGTQRDTPVEADALNEQMVKLGNEIKRMYGNETAIQDADIEEQTAKRKYTFQRQAQVKQKIAAILHERGLSPDKATEELKDKVVNKYLPDEDKEIWYNNNKAYNNTKLPSTGLGYSFKNDFNSFVKDAVSSTFRFLLTNRQKARAAQVLAELSESKLLGEDPQYKARLGQLKAKEEQIGLSDKEKEEKESLETYTNIRSKWEKRFDLAGTGLGTIMAMGTVSAFTGGLLNARNIPTAIKSLIAPSQASMRGRLATSVLTFYESNARNALKEYPNDKDWFKRGLKAGLDTAVDSLTEMLFPEEKILSGIGKREVAKMVSNLTAKNLNATLNSNVFKDIARAMIGGSKRLVAVPLQESAEELIAATLKETYDGAINPDPDRQALDIKQMIEIGENTLWSSGLLGVPKALFGGKSNKVPLNALWDSVSTQDGYITQKMTIERLKRDGELTEAEAKDRLDNLELGRNEYLNNPILSGDMGGLDAGQKQNYFARILNEAILKKQADAVTDPNLKKQYEQQIKESEAIREKIYKGEIKVTPENEEVTKQEFEKKQKEQPTIDQDRVLGDEEVELTPEQKVLQQAIDNNEVDGMFLDMAKAAVADPQQAKQLLDEAKSQATGQVAGELGSARSGVEKAWGKTIADFVAPKAEAGSGGVEAKKADIERRRQEELNKVNQKIEKLKQKEDRRVKTEKYRTLDINDNPVEVEITTNADGTRVLKARQINEDGSVEPMAYVTERINNKAQASLTNEKLIEGYIGNEGNTLKRTNIDENHDQTYIDKINAKYDAELSALEESEGVSGSALKDVEETAKKIVGESAFEKLKKEGYTIEKGKFDSDAYASFFGLHTGVQASEFENAGLRLVKPSEKIKVYRGKGKNVADGENEGVTWVAEDKKVAENYSGDGNVEEVEVSKPKNPFPNPTDTIHVKGSDVGNKLRLVRDRLFKEGKLTKDQALEASKAIDEFVSAAGEESELYSTKTNKKGVSTKYVKALQALGFDGIVQKESYNSGSPFTATKTGNETNTYGIFKAPTQYTEAAGGSALKDVESTAKALEGVDELKSEKGFSFVGNKKLKGEKHKGLNFDELINRLATDFFGTYGVAKSKSTIESEIDALERLLMRPDTFKYEPKKAKPFEEQLKLLESYRDKGIKNVRDMLISEAYHKAKSDGSNPELVKAVEELLGKPTEKQKTETTPTVSSEGVSGSALKDVESKIKSIIPETKIVNKNKEPIKVYHGTRGDGKFMGFENGDIGFHFGRKETAQQRGDNVLEVYLNIKHPIDIKDKGAFEGQELVDSLYEAKVLTKAEYDYFTKEMSELPVEEIYGYNTDINKQLRDKIKEKGYDGFTYTNMYEGAAGKSFIALDKNQIIFADGRNLKAIETSKAPTQYTEAATPTQETTPVSEPTTPPTTKAKELADKSVGKYEKKAREIADKIQKSELPDWLKADLPDGTKKAGASYDQLKKALADAVIEMGRLLDKGVEYSQAIKQAVKDLVSLQGEENRDTIEKGFEKYYTDQTQQQPPPPQTPKQEPKEVGGGKENGERRFTKQMLEDEEIASQESKKDIEKTLEYVRLKNIVSVSEAAEVIQKVGVDEAQNFVMNDKGLKGAVRVVLGQVLIRKYGDLAVSAKDEETRNYYYDKQIQTATFVTEKLATEPGQMIQAFSLWSELSPEAQLRDASKDLKKQGEKKLKKRKKDIDNIGNKFNKANEDSATEAVRSVAVADIIKKDDSQKVAKAKSKIAKARERRANLIKKYKKGKGGGLTLSTGGLTKEGIEFIGEVAKTYIDEGIANIELLVEKAVAAFKDVTGNDPDDKTLSQIKDESEKQLNKSDTKLISGALSDKSIKISEIVKQHYTVVEKAKKSLAQKLMDEAGLEQSNAQELAQKVEAAFDRIATKKKRDILYREKARFDKINRTLQGSKKVEKKTVADDIIRYTNLGAFNNQDFSDMLSEKFGLGQISPEQAAKLQELANKVQKSPEGTPKRDATEDLLAYRAKLRGNDLGETAQAVWYANVLSGYKTQEKNIVSTFFQSMGELVSQMEIDPKAIPYIIAGYVKGVSKRGFIEALNTLTTGRSPIHIKKVETPGALERKRFKGGNFNPANWFKYVMRTMVAFDVISFQGLKEARGYQLARREAAKMGLNTWSKKGWNKVNEILYHTKERWSEAELQAEEEGLSGVQKRRRIYELMEESRPQEMKEESYGFAAKGTFNHESEGTLGALTNALSGMLDAVNIRGVQPLRLVIPFTRIITNVVNNTLDYTPVGLIRAARGIRGFRTFEQSQLTKPAFKELTREERKTLIAKAALGITLTAAFQALHIAGVITITGGGPDDENKKRQLRESGWQPYSIKIGNKWYSYQYTPLVFMLGYLGNMNDADKYLDDDEDTFGKRVQLATSRIGGQVVDMTWINSASTFMGALAETNPEQQSKKVQNSLAGMARGFVPFSGFINQSSEAIQKIYNIPQKQVNNAWQGLIQNIPIARNSLNNKINALGDPIVRDIDVFVSTETKDPVWKFLLDKGGWVAPVNRGTLIKIDKNTGEEVPYTDDEYYEFSKLRGGKIKDDIEKMLKEDRFYVVRDGKAQYVTSEDVKSNELNEILTKIKGQATEEAKEELFGEKTIDKKESNQNKKWNEKINKIINNK